MKHKKIYGIASVIVLVSLLSLGMVWAYKGNPSVKGPNFSEERHTAMQQAFENYDYATWKELMTENNRHPRIVDVVNEDNFKEFVDARNSAMNGNSETLNKFRENHNLGNGERSMHRLHKRFRGQNCPYR